VSGDVLKTKELFKNSVIEAEFCELSSISESSKILFYMPISLDCIVIILSID
jgi:hypothetical protein